MQAIILAAGMGKRLKGLTKNNTKCMVKVNGVSMIDRMLHQLDKLNLEKIVVVVGYKGDDLKDYIDSLKIKTNISYVENPIFDKTNNIYSLFLAREYLCKADTILLESDLIFEDSVLRDLIDDPRPSLALVDKYESWMDGTVVKLSDDDKITDFISGRKLDFSDTKEYYKTVNIYKFSREFSQSTYVPFLEAYCQALGNNEYYEQVLKVITMLEDPKIFAKRLESGVKWYEIDDAQDLDIAETLFAEVDESLSLIQGRYGGYWRFPKLLDFCYLVNPYYPTKNLKEEIKASFDKLLTQYPSGQKVNSLLAAKYFGISPNKVIVGNGAAELINLLMVKLDGKLGVILPTFEEYRHKFSGEIVYYSTSTDDGCGYGAESLIEFFGQKEISTLILINPDNPSGNYLDANQIRRLLDWTINKKITLVIDESFVDFAEQPQTLLDDEILLEYPNLIVIKSISKSHGVPGLRLGILATANQETIQGLQSNMAIWNINSFAEYYLQIAEKYRIDFENAMNKFRIERKRFQKQLATIKDLEVLPSGANYFMVKLPTDRRAVQVASELYRSYNILVKDLSNKVGANYLRIAIRNCEDNDALVAALRAILG